MKKKKIKQLKQLFKDIHGRLPKKALFNSEGKLIQEDEFRRFKKEQCKKI